MTCTAAEAFRGRVTASLGKGESYLPETVGLALLLSGSPSGARTHSDERSYRRQAVVKH